MYLIAQDEYEEYLSHHGVRNQKWGVRRGPPYPLSSAQKRPGSTADIGIGPVTKRAERWRKLGIGLAALSTPMALVSYAYPPAAIPAIALLMSGTGLRAIGEIIYKKAEREFDNNYTEEKADMKKLPKKEKETSPEEDMKIINPDYPDPGHTQNCASCTAAFDLRRRGYDVVAVQRKHGVDDVTIESWYKNAKLTKGDLSKVKSDLDAMPDGARGQFLVWSKNNFGGHSVAFVRENGKNMIYDCQCSKIQSIDMFAHNWNTSNISYLRTDNLKINPSTISTFVKAR